MKVSSAVFNENYYGKKSLSKAILPLAPEKVEENSSTQMITHNLCSDPANANALKYKITVKILQGKESCREIMITWRKNTQKILTGLNVDAHNAAIPIVETLMAETPRALFEGGVKAAKRKRWNQCIDDATSEDDARNINAKGQDHANNLTFQQVEEGLKAVVQNLMPHCISARAK